MWPRFSSEITFTANFNKRKQNRVWPQKMKVHAQLAIPLPLERSAIYAFIATVQVLRFLLMSELHSLSYQQFARCQITKQDTSVLQFEHSLLGCHLQDRGSGNDVGLLLDCLSVIWLLGLLEKDVSMLVSMNSNDDSLLSLFWLKSRARWLELFVRESGRHSRSNPNCLVPVPSILAGLQWNKDLCG